MRLILASMVFVLTMLCVGSAQSQFAPCNAEYLNGFDIVNGGGPSRRTIWDTPEIECVEYFRFNIDTPHGPKIIRAIGDVNVTDTLRPGDIERIEQGARRAADNFARLGDYRIDHVTILISEVGSDSIADEIMLPDGTDKHAGSAAWTWVDDSTPKTECPVTFFAMNRFDAEDIQYTIAHELFHCVQYGSLTQQQMWSNALWWIEGSADFFAALTVEDEAASWDRAPTFRRAVENQRPLYAMSYEAAIFFYWYYQENGAGALMPFLRSMAANASDSAQQQAIRRILNDDALIRFAEAFDDGLINYPDGSALSFGAPIEGERWDITTTSNHSRALKPFVIMPGWADYSCGLWSNRTNPDGANVAIKEDGTVNWGHWPTETDCRDRGSIRYRTIAMHSGDRNANYTLRAERRVACESCLSGPAVIDACMVGTWEQTGGGPMEWLRRNGMPQVTRNNMGSLRLTMRDDGTFISQAVGMDFQMSIPSGDRGPVISDTVGTIAGSGGRWSAERGELRACFDSGGQASGAISARYPNGMTGGGPFSTPGLGGTGGSTRYVCSGDSLRTTNDMPRGGPMVHEFRRVRTSTPR